MILLAQMPPKGGWVARPMASFEKQISAFDVERIDISDQVIRLSQSETTAWFSEIADWHVQERLTLFRASYWRSRKASRRMEDRGSTPLPLSQVRNTEL